MHISGHLASIINMCHSSVFSELNAFSMLYNEAMKHFISSTFFFQELAHFEGSPKEEKL